MKEVTHEQVEDGKKYIITNDDCYGEYTQEVTAKFYKPGSSKQHLRAVYRFIDEYDRVIPKHYASKIVELT